MEMMETQSCGEDKKGIHIATKHHSKTFPALQKQKPETPSTVYIPHRDNHIHHTILINEIQEMEETKQKYLEFPSVKLAWEICFSKNRNFTN